MNRKLIVNGDCAQQKLYYVGAGCDQEEVAEKHRLYHGFSWEEVRKLRTEGQHVTKAMEVARRVGVISAQKEDGKEAG